MDLSVSACSSSDKHSNSSALKTLYWPSNFASTSYWIDVLRAVSELCQTSVFPLPRIVFAELDLPFCLLN